MFSFLFLRLFFKNCRVFYFPFKNCFCLSLVLIFDNSARSTLFGHASRKVSFFNHSTDSCASSCNIEEFQLVSSHNFWNFEIPEEIVTHI